MFNTITRECKKAADGGDFKFVTWNNQCAQAGANKIVALVKGDYPFVITWKKGETAVKILAQFKRSEHDSSEHGSFEIRA